MDEYLLDRLTLGHASGVSIDGIIKDFRLFTVEKSLNNDRLLDVVISETDSTFIHLIESKKLVSLEFFDQRGSALTNSYISHAKLRLGELWAGSSRDYRMQFYFENLTPVKLPTTKIKLGI